MQWTLAMEVLETSNCPEIGQQSHHKLPLELYQQPESYQQRQGWWKWQRFYLTTSIPDPPSLSSFLASTPPLMPATFGRTAITPAADPHTPPHYLPA
jgi:hypothetical protein